MTPKTCKLCKIEFTTNRKRQAFCCNEHRRTWWNRPEGTRIKAALAKVKQDIITDKRFNLIKSIKNVCPGCGIDFTGTPNKGLQMIFELCHYHTKKCDKRIETEVFIACRLCNGKQYKTCGYWKNGEFIKTC